VLIVAHRLSALRNVHRIVTLERGRVTEDGTHAELLRAGGRYAQLWAAQTRGASQAQALAGLSR
jgi:ABC-type multidrug transport system fused ATPase/permease subunit